MTKFVAEVTVGKRDRLVTLRIPAGNTIAPSLNQVTVSLTGKPRNTIVSLSRVLS